MKLSIPLYIEQKAQAKTNERLFVIRPLFFDAFEARGEQLSRATARATTRLRDHLLPMARWDAHDDLLRHAFAPALRDRLLDVRIRLRRKTCQCRFLLVEFTAMDTRIVFTPSFPELWFSASPGQDILERSEEFFTAHFLQREKEEGEGFTLPDTRSVTGKAWVASLDLELDVRQEKKKRPQRMADLFKADKPDGETELRRVGRNLNALYPDELDRVVYRDAELEALTRALKQPELRPILLLGRRGVGKTALLHEFIYREMHDNPQATLTRRNIWLLAPQRLISGMSYVGQWENRVLAIIDAAKEREHTLYFDDPVGLFHAGVHSQSRLSVADLLKPVLEKRQVRVIAECTPEALRVLQETDRAFADMFHVLPIREPGEEQNQRILIRVLQQIERQHRASFNHDILPTTIDLQRRFNPEVSFPGKGAAFLKELALRRVQLGMLGRSAALLHFQARSGLTLKLLDDRQKLSRAEVLADMRKLIIGQETALEAFADTVCLAKARLNDTSRPLGSFLFLGPTGVGKTQCAKAFAKWLFGSEDKLLRFDLNEFVDEDSAAKLAGTPWQPDGLLTSAIRRQPFSVVLLDEVEKAHPNVFDLLLQVLGEGRLTDARGRTADFTNAIIIMTSNLGVREAASSVGLKQASPESELAMYTQAAERFFRPEFFNRIDRVMPFGRLDREQIRAIAELLIQGVFQREGLLRRRTFLQVHPQAMERVIDEGYHPTLGARALKRAIERELARPAAEYLASFAVNTPTVISLYPKASGIAVHVQGIADAPYRNPSADLLQALTASEVLDRAERCLSRLDTDLSRSRPSGDVASGSVRPEHYHYFSTREHLQRVSMWVRRHREKQNAPIRRPAPRRAPTAAREPVFPTLWRVSSNGWGALFAAQDVQAFMRDLVHADREITRDDLQLCGIVQNLALLEMMIRPEPPASALLLVRPIDASFAVQAAVIATQYLEAFPSLPGIDASLLQTGNLFGNNASCVLHIDAPYGHALSGLEEGTHLANSPEHG
ncbi:MAG TPA: AAA family ATPase, partial [Planctomycetota bacterium]|nr:AAA family ATPase [Planctomycetota bacterium]